MAQVDDIREMFARRAVAAGVATYAPDGSVQLPDGATVKISPGEAAAAKMAKEKAPSHLDLSSGLPEHSVDVRRANGDVVTLHVLITTGYIRNRNWYGQRMADIQEELFPVVERDSNGEPVKRKALQDRTRHRQLQQENTELLHEQARLAVADLPDGILDELNPKVFAKLMDYINTITDEVLSEDDDPNAEAAPGT